MTITRPYGAKDNATNTAAMDVIRHWAEKNGEEIAEAEILEQAVIVRTASGRDIRVNRTDGATKNIRSYLAMYEEINGKRIRIKKADW